MAEKKVKGRKRFIGVDREGHLLHVEVTEANKADTMMGGLCDRIYRDEASDSSSGIRRCGISE